jgi:hypothetical protein
VWSGVPTPKQGEETAALLGVVHHPPTEIARSDVCGRLSPHHEMSGESLGEIENLISTRKGGLNDASG